MDRTRIAEIENEEEPLDRMGMSLRDWCSILGPEYAELAFADDKPTFSHPPIAWPPPADEIPF